MHTTIDPPGTLDESASGACSAVFEPQQSDPGPRWSAALPRLLQLTSPLLPVGAYAYSNGLETAIARGWIHDEASASTWIYGVAEHSLSRVDFPLAMRLHAAWQSHNPSAARMWSDYLLASRETAELRREDLQLGRALWRLLRDLGEVSDGLSLDMQDTAFACAFVYATVRWKISAGAGVTGLAFVTIENWVAALMKLMPLGQTAGQRILSGWAERAPALVARAARFGDDDLGGSSPGLAYVSAWHECEYSRLFQS